MIVGFVVATMLGGGSTNADFTFGEPTNLGATVNSAYRDNLPCISIDGLSLYFGSDRPGTSGERDIWATRRATIDEDWGNPVNLGPPVRGPYRDTDPDISSDELELYFYSDRPGGIGGDDIWVTRRDSRDDVWGEPVNLRSPINSSAHDYGACLSADGLELYLNSMRSGGSGWHDLYVARRLTISDQWSAPVNLGSVVNGPTHDVYPSISADGLCLLFSDHGSGPYREGGFGAADIWMTRRPTTDEPWGLPENLGPIMNGPAGDRCPSISADGSMLYFHSTDRDGFGQHDIYQAPIIPIVDFNGDGFVDTADMCIMVDYWGTDESLCDIGPTPLGNGIVDIQDLIVLAEHLFEDVDDPTLVAHWPLDETEGMVVADSAGDNNGYALGDPVWRPDGGQVNGALEFDGIDDFMSAPTPINPADPEISSGFSVLVWVNGGSPGQAIISEPGGPDWLSLDPLTGHLMTELTSGGRSATFLVSQTVITDGNWHRIGFVWDGLHRTLCVDGVAVAEDTQESLESPANGFYIGTGKAMAPETFFSGLIDDVRIYDRVVAP